MAFFGLSIRVPPYEVTYYFNSSDILLYKIEDSHFRSVRREAEGLCRALGYRGCELFAADKDATLGQNYDLEENCHSRSRELVPCPF